MSQDESEKKFLEDYKKQVFEKVSVTTDLLIFSVSDAPGSSYRKLAEKNFSIFLVNRGDHPSKGKWGLPGGFVDVDKSLEETANEVLKRKTGFSNLYIEQLYTFGNVKRDPRTRIISTAYMSLIDKNRLSKEISESENWFNITVEEDKSFTLKNINDENIKFTFSLPETDGVFQPNINSEIIGGDQLAFDHALIIAAGILRLKNKLEYTDLVFHLMPETFTLTELQQVYEAILGKKLLAPAFRRMIASQVEKTGEIRQGAGHRPSALFKLKLSKN